VPTVFKLFLDEKGIANCRSLRRIFCGGESLPIALKERFFEALDVDLFNQYGPTEATVDATFHLCERDNFARSVPIGRPIANTQIYILDHRLQPVPIGVTGELYIGGTGLAQGYLNRPDLTAERFIPDPFGNKKGERLYKTGDLASYLPNGDIEFLGRGDYQVKLRGLRIELGEIEAWLSEHPAVNEALVAVHEAATDDARLVAYVTLRQEQAPAPGELNEFLKERGPEFMVPSEFVILNNFPLLPSGKIDRQALPAPCQARTDQSEKFIAPRTPIENGLARIWARVLRVERVGVQDNFFDLGGHSLLAMQMISRAREAFQLELPLRLFFDAPVIEKLALVVEDLLIKKIEDIPEEEAQHLLTLIGAEAASVGA
jgi:acyl-CoA synthetase (AMP-forming)/AMP-acid ligase II/acyl carrier protein